MRNISDIIEQYLKSILTNSDGELIEIKRSELAKQFQCVPSQINYVISTRFTIERGYIVESKRGGGGYIRIIKVKAHNKADLFEHMIQLIGEKVSQANAEDLISRLYEEGAVSKREANLMFSVIDPTLFNTNNPLLRDYIRANVLKSMLQTLKYRE
ncbi:MAG: CtsR family transcriptional regulator [Bacillaceae bacterium]|uniref:Transcriptional regulator CtsR n=1 Tax=Alkalihalobacterium chitinilyticum TaxID=2980103 RepID=A0ABT5VK98_9BACI|nr:CtsR family transcriptional regulator [Alkalihalobacterium chitinilyticum]MDE5415727.1 CtsR family transcriptional regulator [Alkalihalobacterium chitinilyticum]MEB1809852.1 CtsR family transcriptional regulator [Bacillaceae bacterium]